MRFADVVSPAVVCVLALALAAVPCAHATSDDPPEVEGARKFLILSSPSQGKVAYLKLSPRDKYARPLVMRDLRTPMGVAVDPRRMNLFVADAEQHKVFYWGLEITPTGGLATTTRQLVAANNVKARWVAVDHYGNIFFTDEDNNLIQKVTAENFAAGNPQPQIVYNGHEVTAVNGPGGVAVDGFNMFWTNKQLGTTEGVGSVCKGLEVPPEAGVSESATPLSNIALKAYGVCLQQDNIFFTEDNAVWGVKKRGGEVQMITDTLQEPRGCAGDGEGTVYIADKKGNYIYEYAGNMNRIQPMAMNPVLNYEGSYGLAVFTEHGSSWRPTRLGVLTFVVVAVASTSSLL